MKKLLLLIPLLFLSGCVSQLDVEKYVSDGCVRSCLKYDADKSSGPCLTDEIYWGWVCDVAHDPREAVDDLAENQCEKFLSGEATHFVEVTPDCEFIRAQ